MLARALIGVLGASLLVAIPIHAALLSNNTQAKSVNIQVAGRYIVKLKKGVQANDFVGKARASFAGTNDIHHTYTMNAFQGFAGGLSPETVEKMKKDPSVEYVQTQK